MYHVAFVTQDADKSIDPSLHTLSQNNLEYCYTQMAADGLGFDPNFIIGGSIEQVLSEALDKQQHDLCLVIPQGTMHYYIKPSVKKYMENDYKGEVLVGHILDRKDSYYELFPQMFLINVKWWDSIGRPSFHRGGVDIEAVEPIRSQENFHDDYTPLWVQSGSLRRSYTKTKFGWNIVQNALESDSGVAVWPSEIRKAKGFMYQHDENGSLDNLGEITRSFADTFYVHNTESFMKYDWEPEQYDCIVAPASGLSGISLAKVKNLKPGGTIIVFDISYVALMMSEMIYDNWNGRDYTKFAHALINMQPEFLDKYLACKHTPSIDNTHDNEEFEAWFDKNYPTYNIQFKYLDLYSWRHMDNFVRSISQEFDSIYFHTTNAYEYLPTSQLFSAGVRAKYVERIHKLFMDCRVHNNIGRMAEALRQTSEKFNAADS